MNKTLNKYILADCYRYYGSADYKSRIKTNQMQSSFKYTKKYRKVHYYIENNKKGIIYFFQRYLLLRMSRKYGFQINPEAIIGPGLYLGHRGTIIINGKVKMGTNINIATGVTIGQENRGKRQGTPTFGNYVWIGTNAVIVGKISIGSNVLIAPNAYVNFDVPDNSIVVGNPARIIQNENATLGYIQNPYKE